MNGDNEVWNGFTWSKFENMDIFTGGVDAALQADVVGRASEYTIVSWSIVLKRLINLGTTSQYLAIIGMRH